MKKLIFMMMLAAAVSCVRYDVDEVLLLREDVSLTLKGVEQFRYDPLTCQMSHNTATNEFRVFDDKLSGWFILKCDEMPANRGQEIKADLTWTASKSTKEMKDLNFKVEKIDKTGQIWMWCKKKSIGIVIKNL